MTERLDDVFHAMASSTRRSILQGLVQGELTVGEIARPHAMSLAAVSKHIEVLERAGLVKRARHGRQTICRLNPSALAEAARVIDSYRVFWENQLDGLEAYLEREGRDGNGN